MLLKLIIEATSSLPLAVRSALTNSVVVTVSPALSAPALIEATDVKAMKFTFTALSVVLMLNVSSLVSVPVNPPPLKSASLMLLKLISDATNSLPVAVRSALTNSVVVTASPVLVPALIAATEVKSIAFTLTALSVVSISNVSLFASVPFNVWLTRSAVSIPMNW